MRTPAPRAQSAAASRSARPTPWRRARHRDHETDVGDVRARRMRVAADGEAADDLAVVALGDEDGGVRVAA